MKKRLLLVFPDISQSSLHKGFFHYGLAHISSYLKQKVKNIEISLLTVYDKDLCRVDLSDRVRRFKPEIIAFTSTSHSFPIVQKMVKWVKESDCNILTVCGGVHVNIDPEEALLSSELDVVVCGDGERPMEALVNSWIEYGKIPDEKGLMYRKDSRIAANGYAMVEDLDSLPDPDWEIFDYMNLDEGSQGIGGLMLSRGCPYQCSYCCNHKIADLYKGSDSAYTRFKGIEKSISEIKNFITKFPEIHTLYFDDDILPLKKQWFIDFAARYRNEINKPYWCNIRPGLVKEEIVEAFVYSGCVRAGIGVESGSERIRNKVLNRNVSEQVLFNAVSLLKKKNIYVYSFNMVGVPTETKEDLLDTIRLNARLEINKLQCTVFYPYKHTVLYDLVIKEGSLTNEKTLIEYTQESILNFSFAQNNRINFTVLTISIVSKIYGVLPKYISEIYLRLLYSSLSAVFILPIVNIFMRKALDSKKLSVRIKKLFRVIIPPPPTAIINSN